MELSRKFPLESVQRLDRNSNSFMFCLIRMMFACLLVSLVFPGDVLLAQGDVESRPIAGGPLRYDEDWSFLRDGDRWTGDRWEPLKYIPFGRSEYSYLTLGNEFRTRYEFLGSPNWGEEVTDPGGYFWYRALPTADFHFGRYTRLFTELIIATSSDVDPAPSGLDDNVIDILQAFTELQLTRNTRFLMGRQVLSIGSERLVGTRYGVNVLQSFDTVRLSYGDDKSSLFALYGRPVDAEVGSFNDDWSRTRQGWTVYGTRDLVDAGWVRDGKMSLDLYYMGFENTDAEFDQGAGLERRQTIAARLHGAQNQWSWDHELFVQLGSFAGNDIRAWSLATLFRYAPDNRRFDPVWSLQFNTISGDRNRNDGRLGTFNPMFPKLKYFGETGLISPVNLFDLNPGLSLKLSERLTVKGDVQFLWRYSKDDGVYGAGGRLLRSGAGSDARFVATQYEFGTELEFRENWTANAFYAILPPGAFIRETGVADTVHFVGVETTYSF